MRKGFSFSIIKLLWENHGPWIQIYLWQIVFSKDSREKNSQFTCTSKIVPLPCKEVKYSYPRLQTYQAVTCSVRLDYKSQWQVCLVCWDTNSWHLHVPCKQFNNPEAFMLLGSPTACAERPHVCLECTWGELALTSSNSHQNVTITTRTATMPELPR